MTETVEFGFGSTLSVAGVMRDDNGKHLKLTLAAPSLRCHIVAIRQRTKRLKRVQQQLEILKQTSNPTT
jgi:hypothetical protein